MKIKLEDFIAKNKTLFDNKETPAHVWTKVYNTLFNKQGIQPIRYWQAAAVLFFLLSAGLILQGIVASQKLTADFADTEAFYTREISAKMKLIHSDYAHDLSGVTQDYLHLEAMYLVLKEEMEKRPSEKVKEALVLNLLVRINLLNKQLQTIEEAGNRQDEQGV